MPAAKTAPNNRHRAVLPYAPRRGPLMPGEGDRTQALWPWYLKPFHEPQVSEQCRDYVLGTYEPEDEEEKAILRGELTAAHTVVATASEAIVQCPGAASPVRQDYYAKGFQLITPTCGEASSGPDLQMWPPQMESGWSMGNIQTERYIGVKDIVEELKRRQPWAIAQITAKIEDGTERAREDTGQSKRYMRAAVVALKRQLTAVENGIPTPNELMRFFLAFERQRLQSRQDQRLMEQQALQGRVDDMSSQLAQLDSQISAEAWGSEELPV